MPQVRVRSVDANLGPTLAPASCRHRVLARKPRSKAGETPALPRATAGWTTFLSFRNVGFHGSVALGQGFSTRGGAPLIWARQALGTWLFSRTKGKKRPCHLSHPGARARARKHHLYIRCYLELLVAPALIRSAIFLANTGHNFSSVASTVMPYLARRASTFPCSIN